MFVRRSTYDKAMKANSFLVEYNDNLNEQLHAALEDAKRNGAELRRVKDRLKAANACSDHFNEMVGEWSGEVLV